MKRQHSEIKSIFNIYLLYKLIELIISIIILIVTYKLFPKPFHFFYNIITQNI